MVKSDMKPEDRVFVRSRDCTCTQCNRSLMEGMIVLGKDNAVVCVKCAGIDSLVFLPSGDPALTRRASKISSQSHVVWKFSRARKRNERQGIVIEPSALEKAQSECESDKIQRARLKAKNQIVREKKDLEYREAFAQKIRELYPRCPPGQEKVIAAHATEKYSGRVGRIAAAKELAPQAVTLAVRAHIRHAFTNYDELLIGYSKEEARRAVREQIDELEATWR